MKVFNSFNSLFKIALIISIGFLFSCSEKRDKAHKLYDASQKDEKSKVEDTVKRGLNIGDVAPEIALNSPDGLIIPLSSFRGKVVLVDFWASWCGPCRAENPNNVRLYKKYKDKGFEIYGVSLDRTSDAWMGAIQQDGLAWTHVSDLGFWNSSVVPLYNVSSIPATFLLDKDGKIIARDLRGEELATALKEIFKY